MTQQQPKISIIIPCHNEEGNIEFLYSKLKQSIIAFPSHEIIFVDDGSTDKTILKIRLIASKDAFVKYISFSTNFGHQNALKAGLDYSSGDCAISMDADMQHPPELIPLLIEKWKEGFEVVYTIRKEEENIPFFKKVTSTLFYKLAGKFSETKIYPGAADFRLLDKKVVDEIKKLKENFLFFRGLVNWMGFSQFPIEFKAEVRYSGKTKYSFKRMFKFALSGITSFSTKPLQISTIIGSIIALCAFIYGIYAISIALFTYNVVPGWTSMLASVLFIGGLQLIMIGILGEYIGKLFIENKRRPNYIIREKNF
ncbi:MAG: glycosyl transferase family 2 [Bacteroidetes bacterium GWA2_32_17]|nr:MAG: glycosyl transferase family 2 [Bacteroidetes bacterium GWA2_32_17]